MKEVKLCSVQESFLHRQKEECYKKHILVTSECHVKKTTMPQQGFTGESSPLQGSLGNGMAFLGDQKMLLLSGHPFLTKGRERAEEKAQMHAPSCEISATVV